MRPREELKESPTNIFKGLKCGLHTRFAALKGLAKAINQVAAEVDADLIVLKTHGRRRFAHLVALASCWPRLADSSATTLACLVNRDHHPEAPSRLIRDRDRIFGPAYTHRIRSMGIRDHPTAPR